MAAPIMEWSMSETLDLIDRYREKEVLWDTNNANYKLANERENAWNDLATAFSTTPFQVKRKIKSLLASYRRERVKLYKSGSKAEESSKWFAFEKLNFMREIYTPRKSLINENGLERSDMDYMAELLDVSMREGGVFEDESEVEDRVYPTVRTEYKYAESVNSYPRKRRRPEEEYQCYDRTYSYIPDYAVRRDEFSVYGEHIANELRHLDRRSACKVKHMINNIIYEVQMSSQDSVDSTYEIVSKRSTSAPVHIPDSRLSSPSSTNPSGSSKVEASKQRGIKTEPGSESEEDLISSARLEDAAD